jgi:hypothetical protein
MPSKHKLFLKRNRRRQRALLRKVEQHKHVQESAKVILAEMDRLIARLVHTLGALEKARTVTLIRTLESIKN